MFPFVDNFINLLNFEYTNFSEVYYMTIYFLLQLPFLVTSNTLKASMVGLKEFKLLMYVKIITNSLYTLTPIGVIYS